MAFDPGEVESILLASARAGAPITYTETLELLGHRFTRPLMRQLCKALDAVDKAARGRGEPELAVLVVRQSDGLPGQGWWVGRQDYKGEWEGQKARAFVRAIQQRAFDYWGG